MVGGLRIMPTDALQPRPGVSAAAPQHLGREPRGLAGIEVDHAGDRLRPASDVIELTRKPIRCRAGVCIGAGDQSARCAGLQKSLCGRIHPNASRGSGTQPRGAHGSEHQPQGRRGRLGHPLGGVCAGVEHDDHLEAAGRQPLGAQRAQATRHLLLLVARGHDDDAQKPHGPPSAISFRPRS